MGFNTKMISMYIYIISTTYYNSGIFWMILVIPRQSRKHPYETSTHHLDFRHLVQVQELHEAVCGSIIRNYRV